MYRENIECPYCGKVFNIKDAKDFDFLYMDDTEIDTPCPNCGKKLHIDFDVSIEVNNVETRADYLRGIIERCKRGIEREKRAGRSGEPYKSRLKSAESELDALLNEQKGGE